jgi:hypothetical protein
LGEPTKTTPYNTERLFGWIGLYALLAIIPVKAIRWTDYIPMISPLIDVAPSVLGPAGLLFLVLSSTNPRIAHFTLRQVTFLVGAVAVGLEFAQLLPRPGILAMVRYTFDWFDVAATLCSLAIAYVVARWLIYHQG